MCDCVVSRFVSIPTLWTWQCSCDGSGGGVALLSSTIRGLCIPYSTDLNRLHVGCTTQWMNAVTIADIHSQLQLHPRHPRQPTTTTTTTATTNDEQQRSNNNEATTTTKQWWTYVTAQQQRTTNNEQRRRRRPQPILSHCYNNANLSLP